MFKNNLRAYVILISGPHQYLWRTCLARSLGENSSFKTSSPTSK